MAVGVTAFLALIFSVAYAAPAIEPIPADKAAEPKKLPGKDDLNAEASSYARSYSGWGGYPGAGGSYNSYVVGYGLLDDKYPYSSGSYDNNPYRGYDRGYSGYNNYAGNAGYGGYKGYVGYDQGAGGGYGISSLAGNGGYGGYGGYGGNGGINSYYGYNSPAYQGAAGGYLGYGYYNKKPGYGNIYNSGITPSLVTGYRGYSRR